MLKEIISNSNKPVTKEELNFAEQKFQVKLPKAYVQLLKISNGGTLNFRWLNVQGVEELEGEEGYIYVDRLLGINLSNLDDNSLETNIMDTDYLKSEWGIEQDNIILIAGDGHYWIALDYRTSKEPSITYFDTENEKEYYLYNTFDEMLKNMNDSSEIAHGEIKESNFNFENLKEMLFENSFEMINEGVMIWEELVLLENKFEHFYYDRILEIFKMENLELNKDEQASLRLKIGLTVCKILGNDKNIIDKKFLKDFLEYLNKSENLAGLKFIVDGSLSEYKERWNKDN